MLYGHENLAQNFKKLVDARALSHAYLFFGEPQTGKFLFAKCLANYIENNNFDNPESPLIESLIVDFSGASGEEGKESLGIDKVREIERFLYQTPINSPYRVAIIRDSEWLTDTAQNALLKILEEPPKTGIIIATARDYSVFLPTVASRMQLVYFKTTPRRGMLDFLTKYGKISKLESEKIDRESFGRIGRAIDVIDGKNGQNKALAALKKTISQSNLGKSDLEAIVDDLIKNIDKSPLFLEKFFEEIIILIKPKFLSRPGDCREIMEEITRMETLSVNKRIHLKNILWKTRSILSDSS